MSPVIPVRVGAIAKLAEGIRGYTLFPAMAPALPPFDAGAHIDVHLASGKIRQYSLCGPENEPRAFRIAVQREADGQGGSAEVFATWQVGTTVDISYPRNNFPLVNGARKYILVAGGIGITPIFAMVECLRRRNRDFYLYYCTTSPARTAFLDVLRPILDQGRGTLHCDEGVPERRLDFATVLRKPEPGTHVYYCGPEGMMRGIAEATRHWPAGSVHCEHFSRPGDRQLSGEGSFNVKLARSGSSFTVPLGRTIVEVLREHGVAVETSCEAGLCGSCRTRYLAGRPVHNDLVLLDEEKSDYVMICCARSATPELVLDL